MAATTYDGSVAPAHRGGNAALLIASFGAFMAFLDATIVNVCFPAIQASFPHTSTSELSWVLNAYNLTFAAALVAGGRLADLVGRRRIFVVGTALFTLGSVLCASSGTVGQLIGWRVLQALGAALLVPASLGLVIQAAPAERRSHAVSLWGAAAALAAGLGPPIGGALIAVSGWRLAFLVNLPLGLLAGGAGIKVLTESRSPGRRRLPDLAGVALLAGSLALVSLAIVEGPSWHWISTRTVATFVGAAVLLTAVGWRIRIHPVPVVDPALLRIGPFSIANIATIAAGMGMYAYLLNHILWLRYVWHYSLLTAGLAVAPSALVTAVVAATLGKVAERRGFRLVAVPGAVVWAIGLWWFAHRVGIHRDYLGEWLPGSVIAGIGCGATLPVLGSAAVAAVPGGRYATASSVVSAVRQLGGVLGVSILVVIVGNPSPTNPLHAIHQLREGWKLSGWCFVAVAVITLAMRPSRAAVVEVAPVQAPPDVRRNELTDGERQTVEEMTIFRDLRPEVLAELTRRGVRRKVRAGQDLFREGDCGDSLHLLLAGRLTVTKGGTVIHELGRGSVVGELAVLSSERRAATVSAARDCRLLEISAADVHDVIGKRPAAMASVARVLAREVQRLPAPPRPESAPTVIAMIAAEGPAPHALADRLALALRTHLRVVTPGVVTSSGLERAERVADRVLLVAGNDDRAWRDFCIRHADRVVLVGEGDPRRPLASDHCDLLLTGPVETPRLLAWLAATGARRAHIVEDTGLAPIAAKLAGRSLGLALAGGGARALSHVGLLYELEAAGIAVHRVSGASVGAYIAAAYAAGWPVSEIEEVIRAEFVRRKPVSDWTLPRFALSRGGRIRRAAERVFGDLVAEELPRELTVVATDIFRREAVSLRTGLLSEITRASAAVPGLLPPVRVGNRMLVDAAVTGNLPVGPLVAEAVGPVLAANLAVGAGEGQRDRSVPRMPTLPETLIRTLLLASADADLAATRTASLVVTAQTRNIGLLEFHQMDAAVEAGRAAGRAAVAALAEPAAAAAPVEERLPALMIPVA